jgi:hypothetical protein
MEIPIQPFKNMSFHKVRDRRYYTVRLIIYDVVYYLVTFKDLQKLVQSQESPEQSAILQRLRDKPFWIWDQKQHKKEDIKTRGECCFNHIIGLPKRDNVEKPMFEYEKLLYDSLLISDFYNPLQHSFKLKHIWVKKATGLGVSEFFLGLWPGYIFAIRHKFRANKGRCCLDHIISRIYSYHFIMVRVTYRKV